MPKEMTKEAIAQYRQAIAKFVNDPEWYLIEDLIREKIEPLQYLASLDVKGSPEDIKAQVLANKLCYDKMTKWLVQMGVLKKPLVAPKAGDDPLR